MAVPNIAGNQLFVYTMKTYIWNICIHYFILARGSSGLALYQGAPMFQSVSNFPSDVSPACKYMLFSPNGKHFGWISGPKYVINSCIVTMFFLGLWSYT